MGRESLGEPLNYDATLPPRERDREGNLGKAIKMAVQYKIQQSFWEP